MSNRVFKRNSSSVNTDGQYVLYWMQMYRRLEYNHALQYAVDLANRLEKPLLILEALRCDYPWASDRFHQFILEGTCETAKALSDFNYFCFLEQKPRQGKGLVRALSQKSCAVISDHFPAFVTRDQNETIGKALSVAFITIDSNGIIPLRLSRKAPYSAYEFRRLMQKNFVQEFSNAPLKRPLKKLQVRNRVKIPSEIQKQWPESSRFLKNIPGFIKNLPINHSVPPVSMEGTRKAALRQMRRFVSLDLPKYAVERNHPDSGVTSQLSPYLHFGKISACEVVESVFHHEPKWSIRKIRDQKGAREGFFRVSASAEAFLDQIITWRETGFHFCHHINNYDQYASLPDWSRKTLEKHREDARTSVYSLEDFENSGTHDLLWNAAQRQLCREGLIHNYMRMLWGKKILEWTPDPETALEYMIELNNKYAIDGRNPNSYSGIFWILGRFDRPWFPEREIFGTVRWMSSASASKKIRLKNYLAKYGKTP